MPIFKRLRNYRDTKNAMKKKASGSLEDYFLGGRKLPWWALGISGTAFYLDVAGTMIITSFLFLLGPRGLFIEFRGGVVHKDRKTKILTATFENVESCEIWIGWDLQEPVTVTFTLTDELYNAMTAPNKRPGYRCGLHFANMRGNFDVCTAPIAGDLNGDCKVDFDDFELLILDWMKNNIN